MREEKLQILKMVEEGKISSEEGVQLLDALNEPDAGSLNARKAKWLKVKILEPDNSTKVNVTIPVALLDVGMRIASKVVPNFVPELKESGLDEVDLRELLESIKEGASGKLVDLEGDKGEKIEITVE